MYDMDIFVYDMDIFVYDMDIFEYNFDILMCTICMCFNMLILSNDYVIIMLTMVNDLVYKLCDNQNIH